MRLLYKGALLAASVVLSCGGPLSAEPLSATKLEITLTPGVMHAGQAEIRTVGVDLVFDHIDLAPGTPLLKLALITGNVDTVATVVDDLTVNDATGSVRLSHRDNDLPIEDARDSDAGGPTREWFSARPISGQVHVHYSVPANAPLPPRGPAGPIAFSNESGGFSGGGNVFLILPPGNQRYYVTTKWDLAALPSGASGYSSLGKGIAHSEAPMSSAELRESYFMAGALGSWPPSGEGSNFFSAWQGQPPFDAAELMRWTALLHRHYGKFFKEGEGGRYGVFLRNNPVNPNGGTGFFKSFVATYGLKHGSNAEELKTTLAHEMFHTFSPYIVKPAGKESSWFGEGLAMFYEGRLPLRFGMITPEHFLKNLNFDAARYYTSLMATQPNSRVAADFWKDTRIRTLAYDRGMLYFATVDDAMRKRYHGSKSMDDLLLAMLTREKSGVRLSNADWEEVLGKALGHAAVTNFRASLLGKMPIPASDAFGPCFKRVTARLRRYDVGFEPSVLSEPTRIVRGLAPGSAAERAGLRNGDVILKPVRQDEIQGNQTELIELKVDRNGSPLTISYLPRGEMVDAFQWERVAGVPAARCGL